MSREKSLKTLQEDEHLEENSQLIEIKMEKGKSRNHEQALRDRVRKQRKDQQQMSYKVKGSKKSKKNKNAQQQFSNQPSTKKLDVTISQPYF